MAGSSPALDSLNIQDENPNQPAIESKEISPSQYRADSPWLTQLSTWLSSRAARRQPIEELKEITDQYIKDLQALMDDFEKDLGSDTGGPPVQLTEQERAKVLTALDTLSVTITQETDGFAAQMKEVEGRGGVLLDIVHIACLMGSLVDEVQIKRTAADVKNTVEGIIGAASSDANSKLSNSLDKLQDREDLAPVLHWAQFIIESRPLNSLASIDKAEILGMSPEKIVEFSKLSEAHKWLAISSLAAAVVLLFPQLSPRGIAQDEQQDSLTLCAGVPSLAAAAAIRAGVSASDALSLLELGRGIMAALRYEIREDLTVLKERPEQELKDLAEEFEALRDKLDASGGSTDGKDPDDIARERLLAAERLEKVLAAIRSKGFPSFMRPPSANELMKCASKGAIIIINVSFQCDALLIQPDRIVTVPLRDLKEEDIMRNLERLRAPRARSYFMWNILEWLWEAVAEPVLRELGYTAVHVEDKPWDRVWWVMTGALSMFPIHAAGRHREKTPGNSVMDRVVSSYSPTVKALFYARENKTKKRPLKAEDMIVLVGMKTNLPYVTAEIKVLSELLPTPEVLTSPSREQILATLPGCKIFHFAGHAFSDPSNPSKSRLIVSNKEHPAPVTVLDVAALKLYEEPPLLAYLSACSTAENKVEDLLDEGIHVVGAFQLAGFQHVVGALWQLFDKRSLDVSRAVYEFMKEPVVGESVALALHNTVRKLRRPYPGREALGAVGMGDPVVWAAYVHMGI